MHAAHEVRFPRRDVSVAMDMLRAAVAMPRLVLIEELLMNMQYEENADMLRALKEAIIEEEGKRHDAR